MNKQLTTADYMQGIGFPQEAIVDLEEAIAILFASEQLKPLLAEAETRFYERGDFQATLQEIADLSGLRRERVDMAFLVSLLPRMMADYRARGISEEIFWNTAHDLTCKLMECRKNRGVWGIFVTFWYPGFYRLERFALGRLQYERRKFPYEGVEGLEKGSVVYNCHIPSSGPLTPEDVEDSVRRAKEFYAADQNDAPFAVFCSSWLLYRPHVELFPEGSNLRLFAERFTVMENKPDETNHDFWRIFNIPWDASLDLASLPEATSLQRLFKGFLMEGNTMGSGIGYFLA